MPASHTTAGVLDPSGLRRAGPDFDLDAKVHPAPTNLGDQVRGGRFKVVGTVKKKGLPTNIPTRARVRLYRDRDGLYIAEQWSNATTGAYEFLNVDGSFTYSAVAYDPAMSYRAVVGDRLAPVAV